MGADCLPDFVIAKLIVRPGDECWGWKGRPNNSGHIGLSISGQKFLLHRLVYAAFIGPIPPGGVIHHLCNNPSCSKPTHLELVESQAVHVMMGNAPMARQARQTHCKRGHPLSGDNLVKRRAHIQHRSCRECSRLRAAASRRGEKLSNG